MKHDTHIFLATEAIDQLAENAGQSRTVSGRAVGRTRRRKLEAAAKDLQRLLLYHRDAALEAAWAPDDVLADKALYHTFKLFTEASFPKPKKPPAGAQVVLANQRTETAARRALRLPAPIDRGP